MDLSAQVREAAARGAAARAAPQPPPQPPPPPSSSSDRPTDRRSHRIGMGTRCTPSATASSSASSTALLGASKEAPTLPLPPLPQRRSPLAAAAAAAAAVVFLVVVTDCSEVDFLSILRPSTRSFRVGPDGEAGGGSRTGGGGRPRPAAFARTKLRIFPLSSSRLSAWRAPFFLMLQSRDIRPN